MFKCLQIICAKYYELRCMFKKIKPRQIWHVYTIRRKSLTWTRKLRIKLNLAHVASLLDTASKFALFSASSLQDEMLITSKPTLKLKHANNILLSTEYLCQMSSKSILIIYSYSVSKLVHFS